MPRIIIGPIVGVLLAILTGCATNPNVVDHAFGFDMTNDGQDAELLDYRYGSSKLPVHAPESAVLEGKTIYSANVNGPMLRGDFLYVKWRNKNTKEVYEDTVDLRQRLPANIADHRIHFIIRGSQLYVYLIPPKEKKRPPGTPPNGPRMYDDLNVITIYPDQPRK
jgi:hypothetical protein